MISKYHRILLTVLASTLFIGSPVLFADDYRQNRVSLSGIRACCVLVEKLTPEIEKTGLNDGLIRRDVESRLQRAGIKTIKKADSNEVLGSPCLYVNASILRLETTKEYIYSIHTAFKQDVYSMREAVTIVGAVTWSTGVTIGITGNLDRIRSSIGAQVDQFITAYFDVNAR